MTQRSLLIFLAFLTIIFSCSKEETSVDAPGNPPLEGEGNTNIKTVGFQIGGEIENLNKAQLSRAANDDLFAMQFFNVDTQKPYAHVLGDDISQIKVDFFKDQSYRMKMTYVKNGKNLIPNYNGSYSAPFSRSNNEPSPFNKVFYSSEIRMFWISSPIMNTQRKGGLYLEADRYHGIIDSLQVNTDEEKFTVELKRVVFGVNLNVQLPNQDEDTLYFALNSHFGSPREYFLPITEGKSNLEIPYLTLGFPGQTDQEIYDTRMDRAIREENYQEKIHLSIGTADHYTLFFDDSVTVSRNKLLNISLAPELEGATPDTPLQITFDEEMLERYIEITN